MARLRRFAEALPSARSIAALALTAALIAACAQPQKAICPRIAVLDQASRVTKFAPGDTQDPANVMYAAEMTEAKISCAYRGQLLDHMESSVKATIVVRKGPKMKGERARLTYFVVVTDRRGNVLTKKAFPIAVDFKGRKAVQFVEDTWQIYDLTKGGSGALYETWLGFQLTNAELDYNRSRQDD